MIVSIIVPVCHQDVLKIELKTVSLRPKRQGWRQRRTLVCNSIRIRINTSSSVELRNDAVMSDESLRDEEFQQFLYEADLDSIFSPFFFGQGLTLFNSYISLNHQSLLTTF